MENDIFYSLNIADIRNVARNEFDVELSDHEIETVKNEVAKRLDWYGVVSDSISSL